MSEAMMTGRTDSTSTSTPGPRFRISGLMLLVLGACLSLALVGRPHISRTGVRFFFGYSELTPWLGVALAPIGVALALALVLQAIAWSRSPQPDVGRNWPLGWRGIALVFLLMLMAEESSLLSMSGVSWSPVVENAQLLEARLRLLPCAEGLLMSGLVLGLRSRRAWAASDRPGRANWAGAAVAGIGGVLIVAMLMLIPYLVLVAIEAVVNAMMRPGEGGGFQAGPAVRPVAVGLAGRLDAAVPAIGLALLAGLVTAGWLGVSLRGARARSDQNSARALGIGLGLAVATLATAAHLVWSTLPAIQPLALSGLEQTIDARAVGGIVLAFGVFSAGLVAHVLVTSEDIPTAAVGRTFMPEGRLVSRLAKGLPVVVLLLVILASLAEIQRRFGFQGHAFVWSLIGSFDPLKLRGPEVWRWLRDEVSFASLGPDASLWFPVLVIPWLGWRALVLLIAARDPRPAPLDRVFVSRAVGCRFLGAWCALWALCLASIPTLGLAGLVILHRVLAPLAP